MIRLVLMLILVSSCSITYEKNFGGDKEVEEKPIPEYGTFQR